MGNCKKEWTIWLIFLIMFVCFLGISIEVAKSHDWYPRECCSDQDCAPILKMERINDENFIVVTKHSWAIWDKNIIKVNTLPNREFFIPEPDGDDHACIRVEYYFEDEGTNEEFETNRAKYGVPKGTILCIFFQPKF